MDGGEDEGLDGWMLVCMHKTRYLFHIGRQVICGYIEPTRFLFFLFSFSFAKNREKKGTKILAQHFVPGQLLDVCGIRYGL